MIISMKPIPAANVTAYLSDSEETKNVRDYIKKFSKIEEKEAQKLIEELRALNNIKLHEGHFVRIADFLPKDAEDVHKVCNDVSLDEQEVNSIVEIVKKY